MRSPFSFFFFKQKTAYEGRIIDWSSDVCSSDLVHDSLYDAMCEEIATYARGAKVAGGRDPEAQFGPVQNKAQYDKVLSYLEGARASGQIIAGGDVPKGPGYFVPLTVVRGIVRAPCRGRVCQDA